jgi:hypothetical protein
MSTGDSSEGPAWNKFWMSFDNETESMMSGEGGSRHPQTEDGRSLMSPEMSRPGVDRLDSVMPTDSASHTGGRDSPDPSAFTGAANSYEDIVFPFKFKAPSGRVHRLQVVPSAGMSELVSVVAEKLGSEAEAIGGVPTFDDGKLSRTGFALSYLDNEGDTVSMTTDRDLLDAISLAQLTHQDKVDLFVHDPEKAPLPATLAPQPSLVTATPSESQVRERKVTRSESDEEESETSKPRRKERQAAPAPAQEQLIAGVSNDLLLPGAIVTLAVAIVGVFAISRMSSK